MAIGLLAGSAEARAQLGPIQQITNLSPAPDYEYCGATSIAYNAELRKTLVVYVARRDPPVSDGTMYVALVGNDGRLASPAVALPTNHPIQDYGCDPPNLAAGGDGWLVTWTRSPDTRVFGQLIDGLGQPTGNNIVLSSKSSYSGINTTGAAWSAQESRFLVTWQGDVSAAFPGAAHPEQVIGRFVGATGVGIGDDFLVTDAAFGAEYGQGASYGGGRWIIVVQRRDGRVIGQAVTSAGRQGSEFVIGSVGSRSPSIVYNEAEGAFLVAYRIGSGRAGGAETVHRLSSTGSPVGSEIDLGMAGVRPYLAEAGRDGYLVAFHRQFVSGQNTFGVYGVRVGADGTVDGAPRLLSSPSPFTSFRPSVAYSAATGRFLVAWTGNPTTPDAANYFTRAWTVTEPRLTVTTAGNGTIVSDPSGIACGTTCVAAFPLDSTVELTATANAGSSFAGWSGGCTGTGACTVTMSEMREVTATFTADAPTPEPSPAPSRQPDTTPAASPATGPAAAPARGPVPRPEVSILSATAQGRSQIRVRVRVNRAGTIRITGTHATLPAARSAVTVACRATRTVRRAGTTTVACPLRTATQRLLAERDLVIDLQAAFSAGTGAAKATARASRPVRIDRVAPSPSAVTG